MFAFLCFAAIISLVVAGCFIKVGSDENVGSAFLVLIPSAVIVNSLFQPTATRSVIWCVCGILLMIATVVFIIKYEGRKTNSPMPKETTAVISSPKDKIISSVIPDGIALDQNDLPYVINKKYGYGKQFNAFVTKYSDCYHRSKCPSIRFHTKTVIHRYEAIKKYRACSFCKPIDHIDGWYKLYLDNKNLESEEEVVCEVIPKAPKYEKLAERIAPSLQLREEILVKLDEHIKKYGTMEKGANVEREISDTKTNLAKNNEDLPKISATVLPAINLDEKAQKKLNNLVFQHGGSDPCNSFDGDIKTHVISFPKSYRLNYTEVTKDNQQSIDKWLDKNNNCLYMFEYYISGVLKTHYVTREEFISKAQSLKLF